MSASLSKNLRDQIAIEESADQEGWLVSYADLITLLFIFFTVMLSISSVSKAKFEMLTDQFNQKSQTSLLELKKDLDAEIRRENLEKQISTDFGDEGLQIQFSEGVLFGSGEAALNEGGLGILGKFARILDGVDKNFHLAVEGHTDDRPIHTAQFQSNWSLSASRAVNVLHFMGENGIDQKRMMVRAYAETRPIAKGVDESGKAKNRRVTLLVY